MLTVNIRKQGGAAIMTIPPHVLKALDLKVGEALSLEITEGAFIAKPETPHQKRRYKLSELLKGATPTKIKALNKAVSDTQEGKAVGRELS